MPRNLPNGLKEYNIALAAEKIIVIDNITKDLTNFLTTRCTSDSHAGVLEIYMNSALSREAKEAAVRSLQAEEKARIMAAFAANKKSLRTDELTQAYIFALEAFAHPGSNPADLIALFHDIRARMPSCYGYFGFEVINDATALVKADTEEDQMEVVEEFMDEIVHLPGEGFVVTHSERRRLSARG